MGSGRNCRTDSFALETVLVQQDEMEQLLEVFVDFGVSLQLVLHAELFRMVAVLGTEVVVVAQVVEEVLVPEVLDTESGSEWCCCWL